MAHKDKLVSKVKTDCFAYVEIGKYVKCSALDEMVCEKKECSFYKTRKQRCEENC